MDEDSFSDVNLDAVTESFYYTPQPTSANESHPRLSPISSGGPSICDSPTTSQSPYELSFDGDTPAVGGDFSESLYGHHRKSIVDNLLFELYDRCSLSRRTSVDSETFTECSSLSDACNQPHDYFCSPAFGFKYSASSLTTKGLRELRDIAAELTNQVIQWNARLVRHVRSRDRTRVRQGRYCDIVTAILQAASEKRSVDSKMRFSIEPPPADDDDVAFAQWRDAVRAAARLPVAGLPQELRRKVWTALSRRYVQKLHINWAKTVRFAFNEKSNPDDDALGLQIVKDLHRTGCGIMSKAEAEDERAALRRVLLAYARWNKAVGYCQGFNILASLLLDITGRVEDDALLIMIYLIDGILPNGYFAQNLRALSVDMAVFRSYLHMKMPALANHLDYLQASSKDAATGTSYEPPLTNVFTMQWFLTMFATCLPRDALLRLWDAVLLDGSEMLIRAALAIWSRIGRSVMKMKSADEFYVAMGSATHDMLEGKIITAAELIKSMYEMAPYPLEHLDELREKLTYNIAPLCQTADEPNLPPAGGTAFDGRSGLERGAGAEAGADALACFRVVPKPRERERPALLGPSGRPLAKVGTQAPRSADSGAASAAGAGVAQRRYSNGASSARSTHQDHPTAAGPSVGELERQYRKLKERQRQAHIIILAAHEKAKSKAAAAAVSKGPPPLLSASSGLIGSPLVAPSSSIVINHLFVGRQGADGSTANGKSRIGVAGGQLHETAASHFGLPSSSSASGVQKSTDACADERRGSSSRSSVKCTSPAADGNGMGRGVVSGAVHRGEEETEFKRLLIKGLREGLFKYTNYSDDDWPANSPLSGGNGTQPHAAAELADKANVSSSPSPSSSSSWPPSGNSSSSSGTSVASTIASSSQRAARVASSSSSSSSTSANDAVDLTMASCRRAPSGQSSQDETTVGGSVHFSKGKVATSKKEPSSSASPAEQPANGRTGHAAPYDCERNGRSHASLAADSSCAAAAASGGAPLRAFNPFPVDGRALSARKVANGARLGLYPPQCALSSAATAVTALQLQQQPVRRQRSPAAAPKSSRSSLW